MSNHKSEDYKSVGDKLYKIKINIIISYIIYMDFKHKYLKYKKKYIDYKKIEQKGGNNNYYL